MRSEGSTRPQSSETGPGSGPDPEHNPHRHNSQQVKLMEQQMTGEPGQTHLLQRQDQHVQPSPLRQADFRHGHVVQQRQHGDLIWSHPIFDPEHVGVHHPVRHHGVKVQAFVHTRHFNSFFGATVWSEQLPATPSQFRQPAGHQQLAS